MQLCNVYDIYCLCRVHEEGEDVLTSSIRRGAPRKTSAEEDRRIVDASTHHPRMHSVQIQALTGVYLLMLRLFRFHDYQLYRIDPKNSIHRFWRKYTFTGPYWIAPILQILAISEDDYLFRCQMTKRMLGKSKVCERKKGILKFSLTELHWYSHYSDLL